MENSRSWRRMIGRPMIGRLKMPSCVPSLSFAGNFAFSRLSAELDSYRFGCAICIESQFEEVFREYERLGVDGVLFSSYGIAPYFQIALRAHAGLNCIWIIAATPVQKAHKGPAGVLGPDGDWAARCAALPKPDFIIATLDRNDAAYDIPLQKARPWRAKARQGDIYREKLVDDRRSGDRTEY
ncbi:nitrilase/cyanide hydratase protein [Rhizobium phaseoli]|nr:nitrilase/cyanide hydratase protein [Rhizobium phaseoli]